MTEFELPDVLANAPGIRAAELLIDGLAVLHFNNTIMADRFWEVAFPRKAQHALTIAIQELDGDDQPVGNPIVIEVDNRVRSISIRLTNGSDEHYNQFPGGGPRTEPFDRTADNDPHDLSWMIDLADRNGELGHGPVDLLPSHPSRPISLMQIRHSLFCVLEPEDEPVRISPRVRDDPLHPDSFELGKTNTEIIGVLLGTAPGRIRFQFEPGGLTEIDPLEYSDDKRYHIEIINEDEPPHTHLKGFVRGDLRLFYKHVIDVAQVKEKDLWARPAREGKRVFPDGDCHPPDYRGGSLGGLLLEGVSERSAGTFTRGASKRTTKKSAKQTSKKAAKKSLKAKAAKKASKGKAAKKSTKGKTAKKSSRVTKGAKKSLRAGTTKAAKKSTKKSTKSKKALKKSTKGRSKRR